MLLQGVISYFLILDLFVNVLGQELCRQPVDLVFAHDASGSISAKDYGLIKQFTKSIIDTFKIGVDDTHVGVIVYSENAKVAIRLDETFDKVSLKGKVDNIPYKGYRTAIDDALRVADKEMFSLQGGGRQGVSQILIVLTDGACTVCTESLAKASAGLKAKGVTVFAIGVTNNIKIKELREFVSQPSFEHIFTVSTFEELKTLLGQLTVKSCQAKKGKCPLADPNKQCAIEVRHTCNGDQSCPRDQKCCFDGCERKCISPLANCLSPIEIGIALDSSSSVTDEEYRNMKNFAKTIIDSFPISQRDARFAVLLYGSTAHVPFKLVTYDTAKEIKFAIDKLPHLKTGTRIDIALKKAKSDIFSLNAFVRQGRPMVFIIITDGNSNIGSEPLENAVGNLKEYGVKVLVLGVGREVNLYSLKKFASEPHKDYIYTSSKIGGLRSAMYDMVTKVCREKPGVCPKKKDGINCVSKENDCDHDFDCYGKSKCCNDGCRKTCITLPPVCQRKVDMAFALADSINIGRSNFERFKSFVKGVIQDFKVGPDETHLAVATFNDRASFPIKFSDAGVQRANRYATDAVDRISYSGRYSTQLDVALREANNQLFTKAGGMRDGVAKFFVVLVDGGIKSNPELYARLITPLKEKGVSIIAVGVGLEVSVDALKDITATEDKGESRVFLGKRIEDMDQFIQDVSINVCFEASEKVKPKTGELKGACGPPKCIKGPKGQRGRQGGIGNQGSPGPKGKVGPIGLQGNKGIKGEAGVQGGRGQRGDQGIRGMPGHNGINGIPGFQGLPGRTGDHGTCGVDGVVGDEGPDGPIGIDGLAGDNGLRGPRGQKGEPTLTGNIPLFKGIKGDIGSIGTGGEPGMDGEDGFDGADGIPGDLGDLITPKQKQGEPGDRGDAGDIGESGTSFNQWREGSKGIPGLAGPVGIKGEKGDDGDNSLVRGDKGERGDPGEKGRTGVAGPDGIEGNQGKDGDSGVVGEPGSKGEPGGRGRTGPRGDQGVTGSDGGQGATGPPGDPATESRVGFRGKRGEKGFAGSQGTDGQPGEKGKKGEIGDPGPVIIGPPGLDGPIGPQGKIGPTGYPGFPGMTGVPGETGFQGPKGERGPDGPSGKIIPGEDGMDGPPGPPGPAGAFGDTGKIGVKGKDVQVKDYCTEGVCPKGIKGFPGRPGSAGPNGPVGPPGPTGLKGIIGGVCPRCPSGDVGEPGEPGQPGRPGNDGERGPPGQDGPDGSIGQSGADGENGQRGDKGKVGALGDPGPPGAKGTDAVIPESVPSTRGDPGDQGLTGVRGPRGHHGKDGILGVKGSRGPIGIKGAKGDAGIPGRNGEPGTRGAVGEKGSQGASIRGKPGDKGIRGEDGKRGNPGDGGPAGRRGDPGTKPPIGISTLVSSGDRGIHGPTGSDGDPGAEGPPGPPGKEGLKGERGKPGYAFLAPKGERGLPGSPGPVGEAPRGFKGDKGEAGQPGQPGFSGDPGKKGDQGNRGRQGASGRDGVKGRPEECLYKTSQADIAFVLDSSSSVGRDNFRRQKEFVKNVISFFPISSRDVHIGVIQYSTIANIEIDFDDFFDSRDLYSSIDNIPYQQGGQRLDVALQLAYDQLFQPSRGARQEVVKVLMVITDGFESSSNDVNEIISQATRLAEGGIQVFTVGIGFGADSTVLRQVAASPVFSFSADSFGDLLTNVNTVRSRLLSPCKGEAGDPGLPGLRGDIGPAGPHGSKGPKGFSSPGPSGPVGIRGQKGDPADLIPGSPGNQGLMGFPGAHGQNGQKGQRGPAGKDGNRGPKGFAGGTGVAGPKGFPGRPGRPGPQGSPGPELCNYMQFADVAFVVDSSRSIGYSNFEKIKSFMKELVNAFRVGSQSRFSVLTFDDYTSVQVRFNDYLTNERVKRGIDSIRYNGGRESRLDLALNSAANDVFNRRNGARPEASKVIILITDGGEMSESEIQAASFAADQLKDRGVKIFVSSVGANVIPNQLLRIVHAPSDLLFAIDFDELQKLDVKNQLLILQGCKGPTGPQGNIGIKGKEGFPGIQGGYGERGENGPTGYTGQKGQPGEKGLPIPGLSEKGQKGSLGSQGPPGLPGCAPTERDTPLDLAFLLDSSASLYLNNFEKEKRFIKSIIDTQVISNTHTQIGLISYSVGATTRIKFNSFNDKSVLKSAIDRIPYEEGRATRIDKALELAATDLFVPSGGARENVKKILVLLTDGRQTQARDLLDLKELRRNLIAKGIEIFVVGIGMEIDFAMLRILVTKDQYVFYAKDFNGLNFKTAPELRKALVCEGGPRGEPGDPGPPGPSGKEGNVGAPGQQVGAKGERGPKGYSGFPGKDGADGRLGRDGSPGAQGQKGEPGKVGVPGFPGTSGPRGPRGFTGYKGELGDVGPAPKGVKGKTGEPGPVDPPSAGMKGSRGEPGVLGFPGRPGDDYYGRAATGEKGLKGVPGDIGPTGSHGRLISSSGLVDPNKSGFKGLPGEKGQPGQRGPFGDKGNPGTGGPIGITGPRGDTGEPGANGPRGTRGDVGPFSGNDFKGQRGEMGRAGPVGAQGPVGPTGGTGFMGLDGNKGIKGDPGPPGRGQIPSFLRVKGEEGDFGPTGDQGEQGPKGDMGEVIGGIKGEKGYSGGFGVKGEMGSIGPGGLEGFAGLEGPKGFPGFAGSDGDPGSRGPVGLRGEPGDVLNPSGETLKGDTGESGPAGPQGPAGDNGSDGFIGPTGIKGKRGLAGTKGEGGFPGIPGDDGQRGRSGPKGFPGAQGPRGPKGLPGPVGGTGAAEGFYIVRHSQTSQVPSCPRGYRKLWDGYSILYSVGNGQSHGQDLGDAGSCARVFSAIPFLFCEVSKNCKYASRNDFMYWLAAERNVPMMPVQANAIEPFISRCSVCEAPAVHLAVHSQDTVQPSCPLGWHELWSGYSFLMATGSGGTGSGQSLTSSGSCLENFRANPFIECQGERGTCHYFSDKYSFWLSTVDQQGQFQMQDSLTLSQDKGQDLTSRVSRCKVCLRSSRTNVIDPLHGRNQTDPNIITRVVRQISKIWGS